MFVLGILPHFAQPLVVGFLFRLHNVGLVLHYPTDIHYRTSLEKLHKYSTEGVVLYCT